MGYNKRNTIITETAAGKAAVKRHIKRLLAAALGVYLAMGLGRTAGDLLSAAEQRDKLASDIQRAETRIREAEAQRAMTDEEVRRWAWRTYGMTAGDDVVFFDGGYGAENKGG